MKKNLKRNLALCSLISLPLLLVSCGSSPSANVPNTGPVPGQVIAPPAVATGCPAGTLPLPYACTPVGDFPTTCRFNGGQLILSNQSTASQVCRINIQVPTSWSTVVNGYIPLLNPASPVGSLASDVGLKVYVNDQIRWAGSGGWGTGGFFSCSQIADLAGTGAAQNQGYPAGLYATDGTEAFLLGLTSTKLITHNGELKAGFNAPSSVSCYSLSNASLNISRCFDSNGITYPCQ